MSLLPIARPLGLPCRLAALRPARPVVWLVARAALRAPLARFLPAYDGPSGHYHTSAQGGTQPLSQPRARVPLQFSSHFQPRFPSLSLPVPHSRSRSQSNSHSRSQSHSSSRNSALFSRTFGVYSGGVLLSTAFIFSHLQAPNSLYATRSEEMRAISQSTLQYEEDMKLRRKGRIHAWLDTHLLQPAATLFRFCHLLLLFLPVLATGLPLALRIGNKSYERAWYRLVKWSLEAAGPTFVKLGQWAASRRDIFPSQLCEELATLHSHAKVHSMEHTRAVLDSALSRPSDEVFDKFNEEPLGVGAMAQVYKARLRASDPERPGQYVAVKVLHPNVYSLVSRDLAIMKVLAAFVNWLPTMEWLSLPGEVHTFGEMMRSQLDLRIEAANLEIFRQNFEGDPRVSFPKPRLHSCTRELLIEELVDGVPLEKIIKFGSTSRLEKQIATTGLDAFLKMLLLYNFIHSDLHAGNILITFDGDGKNHDHVEALKAAQTQTEWQEVWSRLELSAQPHLWFIDAGLVTELSPTNQENFIDLFKAIATFDGQAVGKLMIERSRTPETAVDSDVFELKTEHLIDQVKRRTFTLGSVGIGDLLAAVMEMVRKHHVRMESDFVTVILSILLLEGVGRSLNPDLDIFKSALPVLRKVGQSNAINLKHQNWGTRDVLNMFGAWLFLETRDFISNSRREVYTCVKYDRLSPNV